MHPLYMPGHTSFEAYALISSLLHTVDNNKVTVQKYYCMFSVDNNKVTVQSTTVCFPSYHKQNFISNTLLMLLVL